MADESRFNPDWLGDEPGQVSQELSRRIGNRLTADLRPVKPLAPPGVWFAGFLAGFGILAFGLVSIMGTAGIERMNPLQDAAMSALFVAGAALFAFLLTRQMSPALGQPITARLAVPVFALLAFAGPVLLLQWRAEGAQWTLSWQCVIRVLAIAGGASVLLSFAMRRAAVLSATAKGATVGTAAGLLGVAVLQYACPYQQALHLLLWHWSGMAVAAGAGAIIGSLSRRISAGRA